MFAVGVICILTWLVCALIVFVNVTKKSTPLGCLTLFMLPIMPFIMVWTTYSGNKKVMIPLLYSTAIVGFSVLALTLSQAKEDLDPFFKSVQQELDLKCILNSVGSKNGLREYTLECGYGGADKIEFKSIEELVEVHRSVIAVEAAKFYPEVLKANQDSAIVIGIRNKGGFSTCFRIRPTGDVADAWYSGAEELCD